MNNYLYLFILKFKHTVSISQYYITMFEDIVKWMKKQKLQLSFHLQQKRIYQVNKINGKVVSRYSGSIYTTLLPYIYTTYAQLIKCQQAIHKMDSKYKITTIRSNFDQNPKYGDKFVDFNKWMTILLIDEEQQWQIEQTDKMIYISTLRFEQIGNHYQKYQELQKKWKDKVTFILLLFYTNPEFQNEYQIDENYGMINQMSFENLNSWAILEKLKKMGIKAYEINDQVINGPFQELIEVMDQMILDHQYVVIQPKVPLNKIDQKLTQIIEEKKPYKPWTPVKIKQTLQIDEKILQVNKFLMQEFWDKQNQLLNKCQQIIAKIQVITILNRGKLRFIYNIFIALTKKDEKIAEYFTTHFKKNIGDLAKVLVFQELVVPKNDYCSACNVQLGEFHYWCYWSETANDLRCRNCVQELDDRCNYKFCQNSILVHKKTQTILNGKLGSNHQPINQNTAKYSYQSWYLCQGCFTYPKEKIACYISLGKQYDFGSKIPFVQYCEKCIIKYMNNKSQYERKTYSENNAFLRMLFPIPEAYTW